MCSIHPMNYFFNWVTSVVTEIEKTHIVVVVISYNLKKKIRICGIYFEIFIFIYKEKRDHQVLLLLYKILQLQISIKYYCHCLCHCSCFCYGCSYWLIALAIIIVFVTIFCILLQYPSREGIRTSSWWPGKVI